MALLVLQVGPAVVLALLLELARGVQASWFAGSHIEGSLRFLMTVSKCIICSSAYENVGTNLR